MFFGSLGGERRGRERTAAGRCTGAATVHLASQGADDLDTFGGTKKGKLHVNRIEEHNNRMTSG